MWILSPLAWLVLAFVLGLLAWRLRRLWLGWCCASLTFVALLAMTPLFANSLLSLIEQTEPARGECRTDAPAVVVVLGGGIDRLPRDPGDYAALGVSSRRRIDSAMAYWRAAPGRTLVISGGPAWSGGPAESQLLAAYATTFGVPASAIRLETQATDTWQNAQAVARMRPTLPHRIVLATSALHMARARLAFAAAGFAVCPLPSDSQFTPYALPSALLPRSSALRKSEAAIHELVGGVYYRLRALHGAAVRPGASESEASRGLD